jgi:hypothetical protein
VAEEFEQVGVKLGGGADEVAEGGLDDRAEGFDGEIEGGEPAADGEADAEGGVQLRGDAVEGGGLLTDEAAELGQGAAGDIEMEGAAEEEALALVVGHEDEIGVVFLIEPEAGEDSRGGLPAFELPVQGLEDKDEGIKGGRRGGLHGGNHRIPRRTKTVRGLKGIGRAKPARMKMRIRIKGRWKKSFGRAHPF